MTLFNAFLEWVRPTDGNYALAQRLRKVVQRVLNHVLEPPSVSNNTDLLDGIGNSMEFDPLLMDFDGTGTGMNDMDWLSTIDWTQGSWMEFDRPGSSNS